MAVQMNIVYEGQLECSVQHGPSNATVKTQAPVDNGGKGESFSPTDLMASALGACMLTIMGLTANKLSLNLTGTSVTVIKEMVAEPLRRIGTLKVSIRVVSRSELSDAQKETLTQAALTCPVAQSINPAIKMPTDIQWTLA